jgi:AraC family transcriptional regulator
MSDSRVGYEILINEVINFVEAHFSEPLPLERMADVTRFSPFHFHRIFRAAVGESPHAYLTRIQLEKAIAQMNHGPSRTPTEIKFSSISTSEVFFLCYLGH